MKRLICLCLVLSVVVSLFAFVPVTAVDEMKASDACLDLVKQFEGFSGKPYRDTDGHYTIGYGTRCPDDKAEYYMQNPMSPEEAEEELRREMVTYEEAIHKFMKRHGIVFSQQQFDAVASLIFNVGPNWLTKGDTLINALISGASGNELINAFTIYSMSGGKRSVGHIKRRLSEANVYLTGEYNRTLPEHLGYVLYDAQGGELDGYNVQGYDSRLNPAPLTTATKEGYVFKGWSLSKEGGATIRVLNAYTLNQTLYAQWEPEQVWPPPLPAPPEGGLKVTVIGDNVNVRQEPALGQTVVAKLQKGDVVSVTEIRENDGYTWGAISGGWVALEFTDYSSEELPSCIHSYELQTHNIPTCLEPGLAVYVCSVCGETVEQILDATGHYWTRATCTVSKTCRICQITEGEPLGHSYAPATCLAPATCTACEHTVGSAMGHSYTEPTCTAAAKCIRCGQVGAAALGHRYDSIGKCTACGALDPSLGGTVVTVTAEIVNIRSGAGLDYPVVGFVSGGVQLRITETCRVNGALWGKLDQGWIALKHTDHKNTDTVCTHSYKAVGKRKPTCTAQGSTLYFCELCRTGYAEPVAALGHSFDERGRCRSCDAVSDSFNTVTVNVTGTGVNLRTGPGLSYGKNGYATIGHQLVITETKENDGYLWGKSSKGWIALSFTDYGKNGVYICSHSYQVVFQKAATCAAEGLIQYSCTQCGHSYEETLAAKEHSFREAACTTPKTCTVCGNASGLALGHSYTNGSCDRCAVTDPGTTAGVTRIYATITADALNVRTSPEGSIVGKLYQGDRVEILEQQLVGNGWWGRYEGGWIYIQDYAELETVIEQGTNRIATVTALYVIVRPEAGATHGILGLYYQADAVVILEEKTVNGVLWARTDLGWINMKDVK